MTLCSRHRFLARVAAMVGFAVGGVSQAEVNGPNRGVYVVRFDGGQCESRFTTTHQGESTYWARKRLDLSGVRPEDWARAVEVRLSLFMYVHDHSRWRTGNPAVDKENGLNESFDLVVNGHVHRIATAQGVGVEYERIGWSDFSIPKDEWVHGENDIVIHKSDGTTDGDDYVYVGIDSSQRLGQSAVSMDSGKTWRDAPLNVPGTNGEYMVRAKLLLPLAPLRFEWSLGAQAPVTVSTGMAGSHQVTGGRRTPEGWVLEKPDDRALVEVDHECVDPLGKLRVEVAFADASVGRKARILALGERRQELHAADTDEAGTVIVDLQGVVAVAVTAATAPVEITRIRLEAAPAREAPAYFDMVPPVKEIPWPRPTAPVVRITPDSVSLENAYFRCEFSCRGHLYLSRWRHKPLAVECLPNAREARLLLVETPKQRLFVGDFEVTQVESVREGKTSGARFQMQAPASGLAATLTILADASPECVWRFSIRNVGAEPQSVKVAFPLLAGLRWGTSGEDDYYYFPLEGGILSSQCVMATACYGGNAQVQVMDSYRPDLGGGLYVRTDDRAGGFKVLRLNKRCSGAPGFAAGGLVGEVDAAVLPTTSLSGVEGTSLCFEYAQRELAPGAGFAPPDAVIGVHRGDWHEAMRCYREWFDSWAHHRPQPSKLAQVFNFSGVWTMSYHPKEKNRYTTEFIGPNLDGVEHAFWWEWVRIQPDWPSQEQLTAEQKARKEWGYWTERTTVDADGQHYIFGNVGDYGTPGGCNERWGGLLALRDYLAEVKRKGVCATLYTEGILADIPTEVGKAHGREWAVMRKDGSYCWNYCMWNMCVDNPAWREYLAAMCGRVVRDTGCDGIRLDQFGHAGFICYSPHHTHTFALPGHNAWVQAEADTCRQCREAMDRVDPAAVLMTEYPGSDCLGQYIDGCIAYDHYSANRSFRPVFVNLIRYYFPRCRIYELNDAKDPLKEEWAFFNATPLFNAIHPQREFDILRQNADAFSSQDPTPLAPTLMRRVYANRFIGQDKEIWMLMNNRRVTVEGALVAVPLPAGWHATELRTGKPVRTEVAGGQANLYMSLGPDEVACVAFTPVTLQTRIAGDSLEVTADPLPGTPRLLLVNAAGKAVRDVAPSAGKVTLDLAATRSACPDGGTVRLLDGWRLIDAVSVRAATGR